jgi:hypothetical protein
VTPAVTCGRTLCHSSGVPLRDAPLALTLLASVGCGLSLMGRAGDAPDGGGLPDGTPAQGDGPTADEAGEGGGPVDAPGNAPEGAPDTATDAGIGDAPTDSGAPVDVVTPMMGNEVICGAGPTCVPPGQGCCLDTMMCTDPASCGGTFMPCDDTSECSNGSICCASVHTTNKNIMFIACVSPSECMNPPGGNNKGYELCNSPDSGQSCVLGSSCGQNATGAGLLDPYGTCN